ncbi:response regulator [Hymenobacter qilianensis]|uniref:response regulator n=1 Tax=Hymenobacter qilianensis TaxID=1385715 RepID=UPI00293B99FA|nr:response regulator [Hymenobacter qilianensis]
MPSILLIEDEPALGMIVKDSLEVRGFTVRYAADGQEGLELFRQQCPDIVVADVMMPRLDGFSLAEIIRRDNASVPIIFLTARSQPADVVRGFELGAMTTSKSPSAWMS